MKRFNGLWDSIVAWPNLLTAARKARRGKRGRPCVQRFEFDQEAQILQLHRELQGGSYRPGAFRTHRIRIPKPRLISAAPYRDRVVHHALMNVLEPILDRHFHPHSYACRAGKGTHAASDRLQRLMGRHRYALQCDVRKFFPSIDHEILKSLFRRLVKDRQTLALMDLIIDSSNAQEPVMEWFDGDDLWTPASRRRGLPIGNLTSQWFANWMLTPLDYFVTRELGVGAYVRYCDDFVLLHDAPEVLKEAAGKIRRFLASRRLRLHEGKLSVRPTRGGLTFVGFRTWATHRMLRKENVRRFRRRVRWMRQAYARREIDAADVRPRIVSWAGHAMQANSARLLRRIGREWVFVRGEGHNVACSARRFVEQQSAQLPRRVPQQERAGQPEQQYRVPCLPALSSAKSG
jgi:RNA-directed DNA polymerase